MLTATDKGPITSSPTKKGSAHTKSSKDETKPAINATVTKDSTEECPEDPVPGDAGLQEAQVLGHSKQKDSEKKIVHRKCCADHQVAAAADSPPNSSIASQPAHVVEEEILSREESCEATSISGSVC